MVQGCGKILLQSYHGHLQRHIAFITSPLLGLVLAVELTIISIIGQMFYTADVTILWEEKSMILHVNN